MMKVINNLLETILGFVVLSVAAVFVFFIYNANHGAGSYKNYPLIAKFSHIDGLNVGSDVKLSGVKIGYVKSVEIDPLTYQAKVELQIAENIHLPVDSSAEISNESLLGGKYISLIPGTEEDVLAPMGVISDTRSSLSLEGLIGQFLSGGSTKSDQKAAVQTHKHQKNHETGTSSIKAVNETRKNESKQPPEDHGATKVSPAIETSAQTAKPQAESTVKKDDATKVAKKPMVQSIKSTNPTAPIAPDTAEQGQADHTTDTNNNPPENQQEPNNQAEDVTSETGTNTFPTNAGLINTNINVDNTPTSNIPESNTNQDNGSEEDNQNQEDQTNEANQPNPTNAVPQQVQPPMGFVYPQVAGPVRSAYGSALRGQGPLDLNNGNVTAHLSNTPQIPTNDGNDDTSQQISALNTNAFNAGAMGQNPQDIHPDVINAFQGVMDNHAQLSNNNPNNADGVNNINQNNPQGGFQPNTPFFQQQQAPFANQQFGGFPQVNPAFAQQNAFNGNPMAQIPEESQTVNAPGSEAVVKQQPIPSNQESQIPVEQ